MEKSAVELIAKAQEGTISPAEIEYVAEKVSASRAKEDPELYLLIGILGEVNAVQYRSLVEHFLYYPSDPSISEVAFMALSGEWNLVDEYLDVLKSFLKGVEWDKWEDIRMLAIGEAGRYLTGNEDPELLEELIRIFQDGDEEDLVRDRAYLALADAMHERMLRVLEANDYDLSIVESAKRRLERLGKEGRDVIESLSEGMSSIKGISLTPVKSRSYQSALSRKTLETINCIPVTLPFRDLQLWRYQNKLRGTITDNLFDKKYASKIVKLSLILMKGLEDALSAEIK